MSLPKLETPKLETIGAPLTFTAVYMPVPEGYIGFVEEIPGANSQGETLDEVRENLREAVQLVLEANRELKEKKLDQGEQSDAADSR